MEKAFIISEENKYYKAVKKYWEGLKKQNEFIKEFFQEKNIDGTCYHFGGNGMCNTPFNDYNKKEIYLYIEPTAKNIDKFGDFFTKKKCYELCGLRKNSEIGKEFAQRCVDKQIIVNLLEPDVRDYFKSLGYGACNVHKFEYGNKLYLKLDSDYLKEDDIPEGTQVIKMAEFYIKLEEIEKSNNAAVATAN